MLRFSLFIFILHPLVLGIIVGFDSPGDKPQRGVNRVSKKYLLFETIIYINNNDCLINIQSQSTSNHIHGSILKFIT